MTKLACTGAAQGKISVRTCVAEFFGTACLVTIGTGAATTLTQTGGANVHSVGAAFGLTLTALMYSMSHAGASQFNPIVSLALCMCRHLSVAQAFVNMFFQCCGGALAGFIISACANVGPLAPNGTIDMTMGALGANHRMSAAVTDGHAFMAEAGGSFFLCMVYIHCICNNGKAGKVGTDAAPLACGFIYYALHLVIGPITGCGLNPARSTGAAVVSNKYIDQLWIFWAAPFCGALVCGFLGNFLFVVDHEAEDHEAVLRAEEDAIEAEQKKLLKSKEGGGGGGAAVTPTDVSLTIGGAGPGNMQYVVDMLNEMRDDIHHLHENEKEIVLDTKGGD